MRYCICFTTVWPLRRNSGGKCVDIIYPLFSSMVNICCFRNIQITLSTYEGYIQLLSHNHLHFLSVKLLVKEIAYEMLYSSSYYSKWKVMLSLSIHIHSKPSKGKNVQTFLESDEWSKLNKRSHEWSKLKFMNMMIGIEKTHIFNVRWQLIFPLTAMDW